VFKEHKEVAMAEKNSFLNWVGFKGEESSQPNSVDRIRELEAQLNDLRSRRDITTLSKEEFEILATETAMTMIKSAQLREAKAQAAADRLVTETNRASKDALENAEQKARSLLSGAETRGRKYLSAAESEAEELREKATRSAEHLLTESRREANALSNAAKREAEKIISEATVAVGEFRSWLTSAISESERLYRVQTQSLTAAEHAIGETRSRLKQAFERLAALQGDIDANIDTDNRPVEKTFVRQSGKTPAAAAAPLASDVKKSATTPAKRVVKKSTTKKRK
jgi:cell division septum initiation protein DivIVA